MENVARAADILKRVGRMVEGFLTDLAETAPNEMDCLSWEKSAMTVVVELGLSLMKEVVRRADEQALRIPARSGQPFRQHWGSRSDGTGAAVPEIWAAVPATWARRGRGRG